MLESFIREVYAIRGGIFDAGQARAFEKIRYAHDAVRLREWDDRAKNPKAKTPPLDYCIDIAAETAGVRG